MNHPMRESRLPRHSGWKRERTQAFAMRQMSLRK